MYMESSYEQHSLPKHHHMESPSGQHGAASAARSFLRDDLQLRQDLSSEAGIIIGALVSLPASYWNGFAR